MERSLNAAIGGSIKFASVDLVLVAAIDAKGEASRRIFDAGQTGIPVELEPVRHIGVHRSAAVVAGARCVEEQVEFAGDQRIVVTLCHGTRCQATCVADSRTATVLHTSLTGAEIAGEIAETQGSAGAAEIR